MLLPWLGTVAVARYCCHGAVLLSWLGAVAEARYCCHGAVLLPWLGTVAMVRYCGLVLASCLGIGLVSDIVARYCYWKDDTVLVLRHSTGAVTQY